MVRGRRVAISRDLIALLLHGVDALRALVPAAADGNDRLSPSHQQLKQSMADHASGKLVGATDVVSAPDAYNFSEVPSPAAVPGASVLSARNRTLRGGNLNRLTLVNGKCPRLRGSPTLGPRVTFRNLLRPGLKPA